MSEKQLLRKDVPLKDQWDPSHIYAAQEDWEKDFAWIKENSAKLAAYAGTLKNGRDTVLEALKLYAQVSEHMARLYLYAMVSRQPVCGVFRRCGLPEPRIAGPAEENPESLPGRPGFCRF